MPKVPVGDGSPEARWEKLLDDLERGGRLRSPPIRQAMAKHPRWRYAGQAPTEEIIDQSLRDAPLSIREGQTISAPHMVAILLEEADPAPGHRCLEVGAGSGWLAAILGEVVGPRGHVTSVEVRPELAEMATANLEGAEVSAQVEVVLADGSRGYPPGAPYDRIIVSCAAPSIPAPLTEQLAQGGRLIIPVGQRDHQRLLKVERTEERLVQTDRGGCAFVPLIGRHGF